MISNYIITNLISNYTYSKYVNNFQVNDFMNIKNYYFTYQMLKI